MRAWRVAAALGWICLAGTAGAARAEPAVTFEKGFSAVAREVIPAVVFIRVEKTLSIPGGAPFFNDPFDFFGDDSLRRFFGPGRPRAPQPAPRRFRQQSQGSGFLISGDGYILTNSHVVGDVDRIRVTLHDGREFDAELVGSDPHSEVAVIRILGEGLPFLRLGDSDALDIGEWVLAVGNPFGLSATLTVGVVSALGRRDIGIAAYEDFIQTDAAINPGNSGGPLLNTRGEVVGVNTAIYSRSGGYMGIGFAIPINMAHKIQKQLVQHGRVERGFLGVGIQAVDGELADSFGLDAPRGVLLTHVQEGQAGAAAGLQAGDIILEINGVPVSDPSLFRNTVATHSPGSGLRLTLWRDGGTMEKEVVLGALAAAAETGPAPGGEEPDDAMGLSVGTVPPEQARALNLPRGRGVRIESARPGGLGERAGLAPGQVILEINRRPVNDAASYRAAPREAARAGRALLRINDGRQTRFLSLRLG